jgi:hypothetical protein
MTIKSLLVLRVCVLGLAALLGVLLIMRGNVLIGAVVLALAGLRGVVLAAVTRRRWTPTAREPREGAPTTRRSQPVRVR